MKIIGILLVIFDILGFIGFAVNGMPETMDNPITIIGALLPGILGLYLIKKSNEK